MFHKSCYLVVFRGDGYSNEWAVCGYPDRCGSMSSRAPAGLFIVGNRARYKKIRAVSSFELQARTYVLVFV